MTATQTFVFESSYTLHYSTPKPVPLRLIIESLQGLERLIETTPRVLKKLTGIDDVGLRIEIKEVRSGSLIEKVIVKCIFESEEGLNKFLEKVKAVIPPKYLAAAVLAGLVGYGAYMLHNPTKTSSVTVGDITNSVVNIGGTQEVPEAVAKAIIEGVTNKREVAGATVNIVKPAKDQPGSSMRIDGEQDNGTDASYEFTSQFVESIPKELTSEPVEMTAKLIHVIVEIRATDLDNRDRGWEGRIQGLTNRIRIEFEDGVDLTEVDRKKTFNADVVLTSRYRGSESEPRPHSMLIEKIY
ncbi:hypothetical protein H0A71_18215 [Alcaligenaceae bacterium]|nr:hypothetical protein [Alcaligenaceae bacterium]